MKKMFMTLLICAVAVWGYVVVQILILWIGKIDLASQNEIDPIPAAAMLARAHPALDTTFRDPFQSYLYAQRPAPVTPVGKAVKAAPVVIEPPKAILTGILWSDAPVAILKLGDKTELDKQGAEIWDI